MMLTFALILCAAGQLPAGCPTLPAPSLGKHCRSRGAAGQDRPHAPGPVVLPTCCPGCCPVKIGCRRAALPARGAAGPVTREALPARGAADVLRCRSTPGRLPHAPGPSLGKRCRPVVLPGQDRPHAPGPWCCRRAARSRLPRVSTLPVLSSCADLRDSVLESVATVARRAELAARSVVTDVPILRALPDLPAWASAF